MIMMLLRCIVVAAMATMVMMTTVVVAAISLSVTNQADGKKQGETQCIADFHGFGGIRCYHKPNNAGSALGMTQSHVAIVSNCFGAVIGEAALIGALGAVAGFAVYFALLVGVAELIRAQTGVVLDVTAAHHVLWAAPLGMMALCALGGVVPAFKAYRTPVAKTLAPVS